MNTRYSIDPLRRKELEYFCLQYSSYIEKANSIIEKLNYIQAENYSEGHKKGSHPDLIANIVERRERYLRKIEIIQKCAYATDKKYGKDILAFVIQKNSCYDFAKKCGIDKCEFSYKIQVFYYILDNALK